MTRYQPGNCPACGRPVAAKAGHPPPKCLDCAHDEMIGVDPSVLSTYHTTPQAAQWVADRMKELEAQRDEVIEQRDALAALCGAAAVVLERTANDTLDGRNMARRLRGVSDTSLARLKAQWQAEAMQATADAIRYEYEGEVHRDRIADYADDMADELRRQAEGDA